MRVAVDLVVAFMYALIRLGRGATGAIDHLSPFPVLSIYNVNTMYTYARI